jgi:phosphatidylinositol glycan class B
MAVIMKQKQQKQQQQHANDNNKSTISSTTFWCPKAALITIITSYVLLHSFSSHKEFRFILPILPLVCILSSCAMQRSLTIDYKHKTVDKMQKKDNLSNQSTCPSLLSSSSSSSKILFKRKMYLGLVFFLLNYPHLFYLAMVHQRSPISVNQSITKYIQKLNDMNNNELRGQQQEQKKQYQYSVHYLMGCHSTPLYSHLHLPATFVDAWTLDCSPECRNDSSCESNAFMSNPHQFMLQSYDKDHPSNDHGNHNGECTLENDNEICETYDVAVRPWKDIPDFLTIFENDLSFDNVQNYLENEMGLFELSKFRHSIKGIRLIHTENMNKCHLPYIQWTDEGSLRIEYFGRAIDISFDHMILYAKNEELLPLQMSK